MKSACILLLALHFPSSRLISFRVTAFFSLAHPLLYIYSYVQPRSECNGYPPILIGAAEIGVRNFHTIHSIESERVP